MKFGKNLLILLTISGVVTVATFVAANTIQTGTMRKLAVSTNSQLQPVIEAVEKPPAPESGKTAKPIEEKNDAPAVSAEISLDDADTPEPVKPEKISFVMPANGEICAEYTGDTLVFSDTFNDFRTHGGIDVLGDKDAPVTAIADGIISKNYFDYEGGIVVEIEHKDGYVSVYKNLGNEKMAPVGKVVKKGETISCIGDTGVFESNMPYHLHLEVTKNGEPLDPKGLF